MHSRDWVKIHWLLHEDRSRKKTLIFLQNMSTRPKKQIQSHFSFLPSSDIFTKRANHKCQFPLLNQFNKDGKILCHQASLFQQWWCWQKNLKKKRMKERRKEVISVNSNAVFSQLATYLFLSHETLGQTFVFYFLDKSYIKTLTDNRLYAFIQTCSILQRNSLYTEL